MPQANIRQRRIRVHVVHESRMMAEAISVKLKSLLPSASIDGWTKSWETYTNRVQTVADVIIIDNELASGGPTPSKIASLASDGIGIVVLGRSRYAPAIARIYDSGAHAYGLAEDSSESIVRAIESSFKGQVFKSEAVSAILAELDDQPPVPVLTARELEIVSAYVSGSGASVPETAERFGLSSETVRTHISHARRKYAAHEGDTVTKMELRRRLIRDGWILS